MDEIEVYGDLEAFFEGLESGKEAAVYNRRFGHFGPQGRRFRDEDPVARPPAIEDFEEGSC